MKNYQPGAGGVNLVKNPLQLADNELVEARNAEFHPDVALGGEAALTKRGGLTRLFGTALSGAIHGLSPLGVADELPAFWDPETQTAVVNTSGDTINYVGGADGAAALSAHNLASYVEFIIAVMASTDPDHQPLVKMTMGTWTDPGVNSGHVLRFKVRTTNTNLATWLGDADFNDAFMLASFRIGFVSYDFYVDNSTDTGDGYSSVTLADIAASPNTWFDIAIPVPEAWVADWRSAGVYAAGNMPLWLSAYNQTPNTGNSPALTLQVADLYIDTP